MTEPVNPPYPQQRTPEQHAAVRRRSLPIAAAGLILGVVGIVLLAMKAVGTGHPPNILAVNLSFCALMMGVGILFYARGTPGTGPAAVASLLAILTGLVGPALYARQAVVWRKATDDREIGNVRAIAAAARTYANEHGGAYPPDLATMLEQKFITPQTLLSPYNATAPLTDDVAALRAKFSPEQVYGTVDAHSDYQYLAGDVKVPAGGDVPKAIIVACGKDAIMRVNVSVAFADATASYITMENKEKLLEASNSARATLGLPPMTTPAVVQRILRNEGEK
jgi:hypothetical protein